MAETMTAIAPGNERAELLNAIGTLGAAAQEWRPRDAAAATGRVLRCFDAMHARLLANQQGVELEPEVVERIREAYEFAREKRYLAVKLDMDLVLAVLAAIDHG